MSAVGADCICDFGFEPKDRALFNYVDSDGNDAYSIVEIAGSIYINDNKFYVCKVRKSLQLDVEIYDSDNEHIMFLADPDELEPCRRMLRTV